MLSASARCAPMPGGGPSLTRTTNLAMNDVAGPNMDLAGSCLAWGTAASLPAHFSDLANTHAIPLSEVNVVYDATSGHFKSLTLGGITITGTVGDHLWLCYISSTGSPVGGTVLDAAIDCGPIIA